MTPILYDSNETNFNRVGLGPLSDMTKATVTEERNGAFYFEGTILTSSPIFEKIHENAIIKVDASPNLKEQRFRVKRIVPNHAGFAEIYAEHVSYLAEELTLRPEVTVSGNGLSAINAWKSAIVENNPFTVYSDVSTTAETKWRIDKVSNPRMALGGVEGSILDKWGGEYRFDNYHINLYKKRGSRANTILAYGRNIIDFEQDRNIMNVYTSVYPYALYTDDNEKERLVTIDGYTVDCENIGNYPNRNSIVVDFSSEFKHDEVPTKARLKKLAEDYVKANEVGIPKVSIKVSFLDLANTMDYAQVKHLEQVNLCDEVFIHYPSLGVETTAKVIRVVWNCLTDSYDEIEIGNKRMTLSSKINDHTKKLEEINTEVNSVRMSANGKTKVFDGPDKPPIGLAAKGDLWYEEVADGGIIMHRFDGEVWKIEKVSADLLTGQIDAENGDVDLINVNVYSLSGNRSEFVKSWWNAINSRATIDGNEFRFTHTDGSYTSMRADGFKRFIGSNGNQYHSLIYLAGYVLGSTTAVRWAQLPDEFKGKPFTAYIVLADSMQAQYNSQSINRMVATGHPNYQVDFTNARVPLIGYKLLTDGTNITTGDVQGLLIAIY